jgi:hypothetical protein
MAIDGLVSSLRKPVMGRRKALEEVERVAAQIRPIVEAAAEQPEVQDAFAQMASDAKITPEQERARWIDTQEADLLLEAGGDPDAISRSHAAGAAQWLAGPAKANGLKVNLKESNRLSAKIKSLQFETAWLRYYSRAGAAPQEVAPVVPQVDAVRELPALDAELDLLLRKRRAADQRFDPRLAIFAQTRYLARLYAQLPSQDWLYQAYHGGKGGAVRLLRAYLANAWPGSAAAAVRAGLHGKPLTFQDLYFTTSPRSHWDAFYYLYGRGDDHRHYWWKICAARDALAAYRADPAGFRTQWESLLPDRPMDAVWYPDAPSGALANAEAVRAALRAGEIVRVPPDPNLILQPARSDPAISASLRPEVLGLLLLIVQAARDEGARDPLTAADLTLPQSYLDLDRKLHPPLPTLHLPMPPDETLLPGGGPPADFDYHTTGLAFDLVRPHRPADARILAWILDTLQAQGLLSYMIHREMGEHLLHIVPSPRFQIPLARLSTPEQATAAWRSTRPPAVVRARPG